MLRVKPTPLAAAFHGCAAAGDGGDPALNRLKDRVDSAAWLPVSATAIVSLDWPRSVERRHRDVWSRGAAAAVRRYEGTPVAVEGYLVGMKLEGPESPNCHRTDSDSRDWHLWLTAAAGEDRTHAVVVETTPPVRANHPAWTLAKLRAIGHARTKVRVSGWLLLDPDHPDQVGKTRGTIWEVHPILRLEVERDGRWVLLDSIP